MRMDSTRKSNGSTSCAPGTLVRFSVDVALGATIHFVPGEKMNKLLVSFLLACAPVITSAADNASLSGTWQIHNNIAGNESERACTFVQNGNDLTGTCPSERGPVNLTGKVDDKNVIWTYKSEYDGTPITVKYQGRLDSATKIVGTVIVAEYGAEGEFTATLSK
jgi:hypothetical protein